MTQTTPILELQDVSKSYGAVRASRNVSIALRSGEVRALAGENGAGKSTIVRMLAGVQRPDEGHVLVDGEAKSFGGPADAREAGVAVIYQEPTLFPDLSIAENVMMGRHPLGSLRRIDRKALHRTVQDLLDRLGVKLDRELLCDLLIRFVMSEHLVSSESERGAMQRRIGRLIDSIRFGGVTRARR